MPPIRGASTSLPAPPNPPQEHVPRPPNAFMLYRKNMSAQMPAPEPGEPRLSQGDLSRHLARTWRDLPPKDRAFWEQLAALKDSEHKAKYPNYKYQPKKKEEKTRLAEERKAEKKRAAAAKKQSRYRSTSSTTPVAANNATQVVAPHLAQPVPYFIPAPQHYIPVPFISNVDTSAPSPPMSAASTPGPDSSLNAPSALQHMSLMSPAPLALHDSSLSLPFMIARPAALPTEASDHVESAHTDAGDWHLSSTAHQSSNWNESFEPTEVLFEVAQVEVHTLNTWLHELGSASLEEQTQQSQAGSSHLHAYHLENFNNAVSDFNSELSVRVGNLPPLEELPTYDFFTPIPEDNFYNQYQPAPESNYFDFDSYADSAEFAQFFEQPFIPEDFSSVYMNTPTSADLNAPFNVALQPVENDVASSSVAQPYVPPSGAANSGNRRVAASYRKDSLYSLDRSSPLPA